MHKLQLKVSIQHNYISFLFRFCAPCSVRMTHILKFETLDRDSNFLLKLATNVDLNKVKMQQKNQSPMKGRGKKKLQAANSITVNQGYSENPNKGDTKSISRQMLKSLGKILYGNVVNMYKIDFDLFGYIVTPFNEL